MGLYTNEDTQSWAASPMDGVDLTAGADITLGGNAWHSRMTIDLWNLVLILGALGLLWLFGGVLFRRVVVD